MTRRAKQRRSRRFTYEFRDNVRQAARGNWQEILQQCGVDHRYLRNSHGPCPGCGGVDRFRFDNREGRGTFYCNQRKLPAGDGFDLLQHVHGWSFPEALRRVAEILGIGERSRGRSRPASMSGTRAAPATLVSEDQPMPTDDPGTIRRIVRIVSGCGSITADGEVLRYLRARRLLGVEADLP